MRSSSVDDPRPYSPPPSPEVAKPTEPKRPTRKVPDTLGLAARHAGEVEHQKKGLAESCGAVDPGCHGGLSCTRAVHPDTAPHAGPGEDGELVQWIGPCPPEPDPRAAEIERQDREHREAQLADVVAAVIAGIVDQYHRTGRLPWEK